MPPDIMKLGIGISTFDRRQVAKESIEAIKHFAPEGSKIVIVDDGSQKPFPNADHRNETPQGVAAAKNKCLELLEDCDYIFLFDDDCFPKVKNWHLPYIEASQRTGTHQMQVIWSAYRSGFKTGNDLVAEYEGLNCYSNPCGVMIFLTKKCLETIGGFDTRFGRYGFEHIDYSRRAYNAGLTKYPFMDIKNSLNLFTSLDYNQRVHCSYHNTIDKRKLYDKNKSLFESLALDKSYRPYKELVEC